MEIYEVIVRFFQTGGPFMYPIAAVLVVGLAIAFERWLVLSNARHANRKAFDAVVSHLQKREFQAVVDAGNKSRVPMARIAAAGIARFASSRRRDDIESAMEEGVMEALPRFEKRTQYLATLANVATLLGLLAGLDVPSEGRVWIGDVELTQIDEDGRARLRADHVGFVFQSEIVPKCDLLPFTALTWYKVLLCIT